MEGDVAVFALERSGNGDLNLSVRLNFVSVLCDENIVNAHLELFVIILFFKESDDFTSLLSRRFYRLGDERRTFFKSAALNGNTGV